MNNKYYNSPMNYTGSKFKLLGELLENFDYTKNKFYDLFTGSFVVAGNVLDKYDKIYANDIIEDIVKIHSSILESDDIINKVKEICPKKGESELFLKLRESYNNEKTPEKLWTLMLSSNNNMMRFNKKFLYNSTYGNRGWNSSIEQKTNLWIDHIRPYKDKVEFTSVGFRDVEIMKDCFYYCDPPYGYIMKDDGTMGNTQISEAGYNNYYNKQDDIDLRDYLHKIDEIGSTFMISGMLEHDNKKCWITNKLIEDGFNYKILEYNYNRVSKKGNKKTVEVIIFNF